MVQAGFDEDHEIGIALLVRYGGHCSELRA